MESCLEIVSYGVGCRPDASLSFLKGSSDQSGIQIERGWDLLLEVPGFVGAKAILQLYAITMRIMGSCT